MWGGGGVRVIRVIEVIRIMGVIRVAKLMFRKQGVWGYENESV